MNQNKKILVIDDVPENLFLVRAMLERSHPEYKILLSTSGEEGFELAKRELPETILLDIFMPGQNGFETCRKIKSTESTSHIPVFMISAGGNSTEIRVEGLKAGADAIISKPLEKEEFVAFVNVMLRIKSAEDKLKKRNQELEIFIRKQINDFQQTEERFIQVSGHALEFFWEINDRGIVTYISQVVEKILGYRPEQIVDQMCIFPPNKGRKVKAFFNIPRLVLDLNSEFRDMQLIFSTINGDKVWMAASGFPLRDPSGKIVGYRGVCQDITARVKTATELKKSLKQINEYQSSLKQLNADRAIAEENERRRIAEYLHDGLGQNLSLVNLRLTALLDSELAPKVEKSIRESVDLVSKAINETRLLTYDLSPPILYELGLIPAITWKLGEIENKYHINTILENNAKNAKITIDKRVLLYRVVSELFNNIVKHAGANLIQVSVSELEDKLYISVIDNGAGFTCSEQAELMAKGGFGLFSIREKLDSIHGSLLIESECHTGTKATIEIPL